MNQSTGFQFHVNPSKEELIELVREMVELTIVLVKLSEPVSFISNFALDACYKWWYWSFIAKSNDEVDQHLGNCPPTPPLTQH